MKETVPHPKVDIIIEKGDEIVLIRRGKEPFKGGLCLPGGAVDYNETVEDAAAREALEETSLKVRLKEILGVYSDPERDPRHHSVAIAFIAGPVEGRLRADTDAAEAMWVKASEIDTSKLAFDHKRIVEDYRRWKESGGTFWSRKK